MAVTDVDEKALVAAYHLGDAEAFAAIVRSYHDELLRHARRRLRDPDAAEDAVQEALLRAFRALPAFGGETRLRAWLHRIVTNVCHDEGVRRRREVDATERASTRPDEVASADADLERLDVPRREVVSALATLPEAYRHALVLRDVERLSFGEVAERTGVTEGNARQRVHRGRAALRRALGPIVAFVGGIVASAPVA